MKATDTWTTKRVEYRAMYRGRECLIGTLPECDNYVRNATRAYQRAPELYVVQAREVTSTHTATRWEGQP